MLVVWKYTLGILIVGVARVKKNYRKKKNEREEVARFRCVEKSGRKFAPLIRLFDLSVLK